MQNRLQNTVDWKAYRTGIMLKTIKTIKPKRPVKESVSVWGCFITPKRTASRERLLNQT